MNGDQLVRSARQRAHLTQAQLAERAGVTQSVVSAYESGRRQPSLPTLTALVEATGVELEVSLKPIPRRLGALTGPIGQRARRERRRLKAIAANRGVTNLRVFGSVARGEDRADSDLDLLVDLPSDIGLIGLGRLRDELEAVVGASVDVVPASDLKPDVRKRVEADLIAL